MTPDPDTPSLAERFGWLVTLILLLGCAYLWWVVLP